MRIDSLRGSKLRRLWLTARNITLRGFITVPSSGNKFLHIKLAENNTEMNLVSPHKFKLNFPLNASLVNG